MTAAQDPGPMPFVNALTAIGSMCTVLTLTVGAPMWVGVLGVGLCGSGAVIAVRHIRKRRAAGQPVGLGSARSGDGHSPRCRAKSAATCRCPGRRRSK